MIKAFSLLEFVFIILILGIVFNLGSLYLKKDNLLEGAIQILNDIQYTQSLAMMQEGIRVDELAIAKREWFKSRWQIYFIKSAATGYDQTYTIFLDKNGDGNANLGKTEINIDREIAVDVINHNKLMNSGQSGVISKDDEKTTQRFNLTKRFGIEKVEFKGSCSGFTRLVFDEMGRVYSPLKNANYAYEKTLAKNNSDCIIRLLSKKHALCIVIDTESTCFKNLSFDVNDFHLIFIKDKIFNENVKKNYDFIVMGRHKNTHYEYFLTLPFEKKDLENILQNKLDKVCTLKFKTPYQNNVLLFKQNDFDATLFFNIIEKQCDKNVCINSFSQLKQELSKETYRLILLDYELIKFDLEQMRNLLSAYKKQHPQSHIIFFSKEKVGDFDCVSEVLSDVSRNDLITLLRKYLPKA